MKNTNQKTRGTRLVGRATEKAKGSGLDWMWKKRWNRNGEKKETGKTGALALDILLTSRNERLFLFLSLFLLTFFSCLFFLAFNSYFSLYSFSLVYGNLIPLRLIYFSSLNHFSSF